MLGYSPELVTLTRGWYCFIFNTPEDSMKVLGKTWIINGGSLMLKRWRVSFDPTTDYFQFRHFWVLLPGLPLQLWNARALATIGNELGHYIMVDEEALKGTDKRIGKVMVEMIFIVVYWRPLDIEWRGRVYGQKLDYLGVPFRCSYRRKTGHLRKDCQGFEAEEESESSMLRKATLCESPGWTHTGMGNTTQLRRKQCLHLRHTLMLVSYKNFSLPFTTRCQPWNLILKTFHHPDMCYSS
jgi:hypothetical protein